MFETLLEPGHLLIVLITICVWGAPIWLAVYLVVTLRQIKQSLQKISESLDSR